jgi:serine/threonine protein kinase
MRAHSLQVALALRERTILSRADSPYVVRLISSFQDERYLYLATELCPRGDMLGVIRLALSSQ